MANVASVALLNDSLSDLTRTLLQQRAMRQQADESAARNTLGQRMAALQEREATSKEGDYGDQRANRKLALEAQAAHQQRIEEIQKEGNADKRNKMMFDFLGELNKTGQLTDDGIAAMEGKFNDQFGKAGIGVKLFRAAVPPEPQSKNTPGGREVTWMPGGREAHVGQAPLGPQESIEFDPVTGEPMKRTVRGPMGSLKPPVEVDENAGMERPISDRELAEPGIPGWGAPPGAAPAPAVAPVRPAAGLQAAPPTFNSEVEARMAGKKSGDTVRLIINGKAVLVRLR